MKKIRRVICLFALIGAWTTTSVSAEFQDSDVLPNVVGIGFDRDAVGFSSNESEHSISHNLLGSPLYFIYERGNRKMVEIEAKQFQERFPVKTLLDRPRTDPATHDLVGHTANGVKYGLKLKYCGEGVTDHTRKVVVDSKIVRVRARRECTNVSSVEIVNGQLWLGTAYSGEGGYSMAEGIIVQNMNGASVLARITSLSGWIAQIHADPFSNNVWAITENGIYEVSPQFKILSVNLFYHDFDPSTGAPHLSFSSKPTPSNPFAVVSRLLPTEDRKNFYEAFTRIPKGDLEKFTLYEFFMCCDFNAPKYPESFRPLAPFFIKASMRKDPLLQNSWRQSICRLGGPETEQYCQRVQ